MEVMCLPVNKDNVSVVLPTLNEEEGIGQVIGELRIDEVKGTWCAVRRRSLPPLHLQPLYQKLLGLPIYTQKIKEVLSEF